MPNIVAKVVALKPHTAFGQSHDTGDTYELEEAFVSSVMAQGMVRRADATDLPDAKSAVSAQFSRALKAKPAKPKKPAKKKAPPLKAKIRGTAAKKKRK